MNDYSSCKRVSTINSQKLCRVGQMGQYGCNLLAVVGVAIGVWKGTLGLGGG